MRKKALRQQFADEKGTGFPGCSTAASESLQQWSSDHGPKDRPSAGWHWACPTV